ncbi:transposase [Pandoraea pnomenusa]|uniref:Transposase n=1 Tax=Pandoraea pnomenusa TaxID=93220 RepID=A0A378YN72_9BURK|nr:transposase [Pandoraea pnomenusa]SUA78183.1 Uncharacterised protein [Pandoraea pnomenusa]
MKKSRFTDSQILEALKRAEAGLAVPELCVNAGLNLTHLPAYRRSKSDPPRLRVTRRLSRLRV